MALLTSTIHRPEPYLKLDDNEKENLSNTQQTSIVSNPYSWSIHNCICKKPKTGLILYPTNDKMKNLILVVCEQCYNYQVDNESPHSQLEKWYFNIYKDSESFCFKSRFLLNEDNSFHFYNTILDTNESNDITERLLDKWEIEAVRKYVQKKIVRV